MLAGCETRCLKIYLVFNQFSRKEPADYNLDAVNTNGGQVPNCGSNLN
jgi:hypothetical protein